MRKEAHRQPIPAVEAARWLVEFATRDPAPLERHWHHPDWPGIRARITAFILNDYASWKDQRQPERAKLLHPVDILPVKEMVQGGLKKLFSHEEACGLWEETVEPRRVGVLRSPSGAIRPFTTEVSRSGFLLRVLAVLQAVGPRLRRCADTRCQCFFVSNRRQIYCTHACSDRVRLARFRARHADDEHQRAKVKAQRRVAYESKIQSRLGAKVKVRSRR